MLNADRDPNRRLGSKEEGPREFADMSEGELESYQDDLADGLAELVDNWMQAHRRTCNDPECAEPMNLIAFLAHSAGIRMSVTTGAEFLEQLKSYEDTSPNCSHLRN